MKTEAQPKLDVQTLEYVLSIIKSQEENYQKIGSIYHHELAIAEYKGKEKAMYYFGRKIHNLIHEQQEA